MKFENLNLVHCDDMSEAAMKAIEFKTMLFTVFIPSTGDVDAFKGYVMDGIIYLEKGSMGYEPFNKKPGKYVGHVEMEGCPMPGEADNFYLVKAKVVGYYAFRMPNSQ